MWNPSFYFSSTLFFSFSLRFWFYAFHHTKGVGPQMVHKLQVVCCISLALFVRGLCWKWAESADERKKISSVVSTEVLKKESVTESKKKTKRGRTASAFNGRKVIGHRSFSILLPIDFVLLREKALDRAFDNWLYWLWSFEEEGRGQRERR